MRRSFLSVLTTGLLCLTVAGCKVTREDIDYWTGTQKGPGKIVAVLLADKYEDELRVYAGLALVRMEPRPATANFDAVDGVTELQAAVRQLPEETRTRVVDAMAPGLIEIMTGRDTPQAQNDGGIRPIRVRAKDAAFLLLPYASNDARQALTAAVVDWFCDDFNGRSLAGNYTAEQVVRQLGAPAAARLVNALDAELPQQALVKLAELISTLGNDETKAAAAVRLVEIEAEMESAEFMADLTTRLTAQLRERQGEATENDEARVRAAASLNRENFITLGVLPAMKHLNDETVIQDRLLAMAQATSVEGVTADQIKARRRKALQAMEGGVRPDQVNALLDIALNDQTPIEVRDYAFDRVADSRATSAVPRLWPAFVETSDWRLRWRLGTLILALGGRDVVQEFFNRLDDPSYAREELHGYGERMSQMRPPPTEFINGQLRSTDWFDRCIALYFWERQAARADIPRIAALEGDEAATDGEHWEEQDTVGKVAQAVVRAIRERLDGRPPTPAPGAGSDSEDEGSD